ncbi:MAG: crotonase/enoyl-CoA hydratase family protein [Sandaracinaceae bacterium]|nr:crotonase/enoyl-CoA hydratase family protein [Sandaracinaceae bacterium]
MSERVRIDRSADIAYVTLVHATKHNALDWEMLTALVDAAESLGRDRGLRGVILHAEGPSFCSGLDFPKFTKEPARMARAFAKLRPGGTNLFQEACWAFRRLPLPVAAVLHGRCFGGGLQLALAADFRFTTPDCELSIMEAKWGLIPDMTGSVTLRELMTIDQAKRLTMTGRVFRGDEALRYNLVTEVSADPMAAAEGLMAELVTRSPDSVAATKQLFHDTWVAPEDAAFSLETRLQALLLTGKNQRAAMQANFEKRAPRFGKRLRMLG